MKPRRNIWFDLPVPLCCVTIRPGTTSRISPVRIRGRASSSAAPTTPCDAERLMPTGLSQRPSTTISSRADGLDAALGRAGTAVTRCGRER